jgi:hypothetical protein
MAHMGVGKLRLAARHQEALDRVADHAQTWTGSADMSFRWSGTHFSPT